MKPDPTLQTIRAFYPTDPASGGEIRESMTLVLEQILNGVQFGITLFLLAAGLTLIFGIMGVINLAHGSLYMIGAYAAAIAVAHTGSFLLAVPAGLLASATAGLLIEFSSFGGCMRVTTSIRCSRPSA